MNQSVIQRAIARVMPAAIATGLFVSLATFQTSAAADYPDGFPSGTFVNVPGLVDIPCTAPPESEGSITATEVKALEDITSSELHHVLLNGYYPAVDAGWREGWQVLIDGFAYDILGVESDSQSQMTRVRVRVTTV